MHYREIPSDDEQTGDDCLFSSSEWARNFGMLTNLVILAILLCSLLGFIWAAVYVTTRHPHAVPFQLALFASLVLAVGWVIGLLSDSDWLPNLFLLTHLYQLAVLLSGLLYLVAAAATLITRLVMRRFALKLLVPPLIIVATF
jgi:hypothetical protein